MFSVHQFAVDKAVRLSDTLGTTSIDEVLSDAEAIAEFVKTGKTGNTKVVKAWGPFNPPWVTDPRVWNAWIDDGK